MNETVENSIDKIRRDGYCLLPGLIDPHQVRAMLDLVKELAEINRRYPVKDIPNLDAGQETIYNLQNRDVRFLHFLLKNDTIRQILMHFLNDPWHKAIDLAEPNYILRSYLARNNQVAAPMHIDSFIPYQGEHPVSMQVSIVLEPQDEVTGCTTIIPGSHQSGEYVTQDQADVATPIISAPGDVAVWDSRVWHATLRNSSGQSRWSLIGTFVRWWVKQGYKITENLPQAIYENLSDSEKAVLGFCSKPLDDEQAGVDFKKGYDFLKPRVSDY